MKERLSSLDLLTANFRHRKTAPSLAFLIIALILLFTSNISYAGDDFGGSFNEFGPTWAYELWVGDWDSWFDSASPATVQNALQQISASYPTISAEPFLKLNQTIAQTITNGSPTFNSGLYSLGNVGIGTTAPAYLLQAGTAPSGFTVARSGNVGIGTTAENNRLSVIGTSRFYGNVGIGTTVGNSALAVGGDLEVSGNTYLHTIFIRNSSELNVSGNASILGALGIGSSAPASAKFTVTGGNVGIGYTAPTGLLHIGSSAGTPVLFVRNSGNVGIGTTAPLGRLEVGTTTLTQPALLVDALSGYVGIGTTSPNRLFNVVGGADATETILSELRSNFATANTTTTLKFVNSTSGGSGYGSGEIAVIRTSASTGNGKIIFRTDNTGQMYDRMAIDGTGNVGIGTTAPTDKLYVAGGATISGILTAGTIAQSSLWVSGPAYLAYSTGSVGIGTSGPVGLLQVGTSPASGLTVLSSGNVGIGTTSPGGAFEITRASTPDIYLRSTTEDTNAVQSIRFTTGSGVATANNQFAYIRAYITQSDPSTLKGELAFAVNTGDTSTEVMRLANGNVGIGTTAPGYKFQVQGDGVQILSSAFYTTAQIVSQYNGAGLMFGRDAIGSIGTIGGSDLGFWTNMGAAPLEVLHMKNTGVAYFNSGNVGIGTTSPDYKLSILTANTISPFIARNSSNNNWALFSFDISSNNSSFSMYNGAARSKVHINTSGNSYLDGGNVGIGTTAPLGLLVVGSTTISAPGLFVKVGGQVGIGTTAPAGKLDIRETTAATALNAYLISNHTAFFNINSDDDNDSADADASIIYGSNGGSQKWAVGYDDSNSGSYAISSGGALGTNNRLTILTAGNVGIGTTSPGAKLEVAGSGAYATKLLFYDIGWNANSRKQAIALDSGKMQFMSYNDALDTSSIQMTIQHSGNVGIGTTGPGAKLEILCASSAPSGGLYLNTIVAGTGGGTRLILKQPDGGCSACGVDNAGTTWSCADVTCP